PGKERVLASRRETFGWLVRLGYAARGVVYVGLGYLALTTAGQARDGGTAVFDLLQDVPGGKPVLWLTALGLLAYAAFRALSALRDIEGHGSDAAGLARRAGHGASAAAHVLLAYTAFQFASGGAAQSAGDDGTRQAAGTLLDLPLGEVV